MAEKTSNLPIQASLIDDTQSLAKELDISWNQLVAIALRNFIRRISSVGRYRGRTHLIAQINAAYEEEPDDDQSLALKRQRRISHRNIVEGDW